MGRRNYLGWIGVAAIGVLGFVAGSNYGPKEGDGAKQDIISGWNDFFKGELVRKYGSGIPFQETSREENIGISLRNLELKALETLNEELSLSNRDYCGGNYCGGNSFGVGKNGNCYFTIHKHRGKRNELFNRLSDYAATPVERAFVHFVWWCEDLESAGVEVFGEENGHHNVLLERLEIRNDREGVEDLLKVIGPKK